MDTNKMREQFEVAIVAMKMATGMPEDDAKSFLEVGSNGYTSVYTKAAWWAWQASREAVVVELRTDDFPMFEYMEFDRKIGFKEGLGFAAGKIKAQCLKVSP